MEEGNLVKIFLENGKQMSLILSEFSKRDINKTKCTGITDRKKEASQCGAQSPRKVLGQAKVTPCWGMNGGGSMEAAVATAELPVGL